MQNGILKAELQSFGIQIPAGTTARQGGAGPAEGGTVLLDNLCAMVPMQSEYVKNSPFSVRESSRGSILLKNGEEICNIAFVPTPQFYSYATEDGIPFKQIALLHGKDCLASTIYQDCIYWNSHLRCAFCGIRLSLESGQTCREKTGEELADVAAKAKELDNVTHITLTTGTINATDKGILKLAACATAIRKRTSLPIHVQFEPPSDLDMLELLVEGGVDSVGINIESFDGEVRARVTPAKERIGLERFVRTWQRAVALFGRNQVSTFIIIGLGEKPSTVIEGSVMAAKLGVYPFIVPLRPIPGSAMEAVSPPEPTGLVDTYRSVAEALHKYHLSAQASKAGCVRCGACSALPEFERYEQ